MSSNLKDQVLSELLDQLERDELVLPTLPEVALRIRDTIEDENTNVGKTSKQISSDAALSARLVRVANSPLLRANRKIETLEAAITRMGYKMLRNIVNSIVMQQMFQATTDVTDKQLRLLWEHSTQVAAISHALARFARLQPDQAMLAGLVHDIGALPVLKYAEDMPELTTDEATLSHIIMELHTRVGGAILKKWDFTPELVAVAEEHENLQHNSGASPDYVDVVIAANLQSYMDSDHPHAKENWDEVPAFAKLGLSTNISVIEMEDIGEDVKEIQAALW